MTSKEPQRGANDKEALTYIVNEIAKRNARRKELNMEIKELADAAWEKCGKSAKAVKALAKESAWDAVQRQKQRDLEEEIDQGRAALGMLLDTPLGQAAMTPLEEAIENDGADADEPQHHATNPKYKAKEHKPKKKRKEPAHATA